MNIEDLNLLVRMASQQAKAIIVDGQAELIPTWVLVNKEGEACIIGTPWKSALEKMRAEHLMRKKMQEYQAVAYSLVVEAWLACYPPETKLDEHMVKPYDRPDRREVVITLATNGRQTVWKTWAIRRNYLERVVALEEEPSPDSEPQGWMTNLLKPKKN
jgi:hypothetical protein